MADSKPSIVVVSDVCGQGGGAYRVTTLVCRALAELGADVTCFATWVEPGGLQETEPFRIVRPWMQRGYRWDIPNRMLAVQAQSFIKRRQPKAVFVVGLTRVCGHLLAGSVASRLLVWELTNADKGNKFVDPKAAKLLHQSRGILSPAESIDAGIRQTYHYTGTIQRLPFWIEDEGLPYAEPPNRFRSDFHFLARREDDKGLRELIQATAMLVKEFPNLRIQVGGHGDAHPYSKLAKELAVADSIEFCSLPSRQDAMVALAATRYLVLPSYHEGYPLSLLEATQFSIPFIATDVGSIEEVFGDCSACRMIPSRDVTALYNVMKSCLSETDMDYAMRRKAANRRFNELSSKSSVDSRLRQIIDHISLSDGRSSQHQSAP